MALAVNMTLCALLTFIILLSASIKVRKKERELQEYKNRKYKANDIHQAVDALIHSIRFHHDVEEQVDLAMIVQKMTMAALLEDSEPWYELRHRRDEAIDFQSVYKEFYEQYKPSENKNKKTYF